MNPVRNQILAKPFPSDEISGGGIFIPESARQPSNKVRIVKTGNGTADKPMKLKTGQTAYRVKGWGTDIIIEGELHFLMEDNAILAVE